MKKLYPTLVFFFVLTTLQVQSQSLIVSNQTVYQDNGYLKAYFYLSNVKTKEDVLAVQSLVEKHKEVFDCTGNRFPVRYFLMQSKNHISRETLGKWLANTPYEIETFGEGEQAKDDAMVAANKGVKM